ncbi:hypothetical protein NQ314_013617 [Rhamnusium bicolor]|uniref:ZAD domain-containing protein n=1 Tax=Rhamnusium bicolor TaxID=1586634 RepID=A0AAV8X6I8_9CUCU|nr:hypothetical protein NQ314_013617 [Rhamnusium bicolor]
MEDKELCKLCLKAITDSSFVSMDDGKRDMLVCIVPHIILDINSILKICKECFESLQTCYEFKTFCFEQRDVKDLESNETALMVYKSEYKCYLCWGSVEINASDEVESEQASLELMMKECLPEWNVTLKDNSTLCTKCSTSLRNMFSFIRRCLEVVDKIKSIVSLKPENKDQASSYDVSNLAQFCFVKIENTDTHSEEADTAKDHIDKISVFKLEPEEKDDEFEELTELTDIEVKSEVIEEEERYKFFCSSSNV